MRLRANHAYCVNQQADARTYQLARDCAASAVDALGRERCEHDLDFAAMATVTVAQDAGEVWFCNRRERLAFTNTVRRCLQNLLA